MTFKAQLTLCLLLAACIPVFAQGPPPSRLTITVRHESVGSQGFDDFGAEIGIDSTKVTAKWGAFSLTYGHQRFDWDDTLELPFGNGGEPWDDLHSVQVGVGIFRPLGNDWFVRHQLGLATSFEAETSHSLSVRAISVVIKRWDDFWFSFGLMARGHQRLSGIIIPALGLRWRPDKVGWSAAIGMPITEVRYSFTQDFSVALGWAFEFSSVSRLSDNSNVIPKGYVRRKGQGIGLSLRWKVHDKINLRLGLATIGRRKLEFFDSRGDEIVDFDIDRGTSAKVILTGTF